MNAIRNGYFVRAVHAMMILAMTAFATATVDAQTPPPSAPAAKTRTVQEIKFTGNHKISTAELSAQIPLKVGDVNTKDAVKAALDKIVAIYKAAGSDLSLMVDISLPDADHTIVTFLIDENGTGGNKGAAPRAGGPPPAAK